MSLPRDWEETGGKPQASPERASGSSLVSNEPAGIGAGRQFYRRTSFDPVARHRHRRDQSALRLHQPPSSAGAGSEDV
jgi:hypothetical protein